MRRCYYKKFKYWDAGSPGPGSPEPGNLERKVGNHVCWFRRILNIKWQVIYNKLVNKNKALLGCFWFTCQRV